MGAATLKTNEGRPGTRAVARHVRVSASKAREVLNLVRLLSFLLRLPQVLLLVIHS